MTIAVGLAAALVYFILRTRQPINGAPSHSSQQTEAVVPSSTAQPSEDQILSPVQLSPQRLQTIGVKFADVVRRPVRYEIRATGNVEVNEERLSYVQTRFPGWIQKVFADATYKYIRKGQPLFTIYSQDLVSAEQEFLLAVKNNQPSSSTESTTRQEGDWLVDAARQRLRQWNISEKEIARLESSGQSQRDTTVDSTVSGYIIERNALPNQFVQPETKLYTVADLSQVWVYAEIFESDAGRLSAGNPATVTAEAYPGRVFRGRIQQILPQVDPATRTIRVRLVFDNLSLLLKPGMYVNVNLSVPVSTQLVIPASGVLQSGTREIAFVDRGNGYLEPRQIQTGQQFDDQFVVLKGLSPGERVVISANFLIDSESQLQAAAGQFAPPPSGAGGAGGVAAIQISPTANIEFSTTPSTPHKGQNAIHVKLTEASGKPIDGASVTVTFFMPAMPQMGMSEMKTTAKLTSRGNGLYEGSDELSNGGMWQVTITAQKNGQTLATKRMNVSATGGM
jgi:Cu(I)/Ag(I) efflux system membrane fusion protein/cobalt-zinc-cadmium efflux system membrane fusion protein